MRRRWLVAVLALLCTAVSSAPAEQKGKARPDPAHLSLWSAKGIPLISRQYLPGLNAALLLSDEQVLHLYTAWRETVDSPELMEKGRRLKETMNPTEEQQKELRLLQEAAEGRLQSRVAAILTPAQKDLMASIEVVYGQAQEAVNAELAPEFAAAKANARDLEPIYKLARQRLAADLRRRLEELLTPTQRAAMQSAAAEELRRESEGRNQLKGSTE